ncbi:MAG: hypothetical protein NTX80_01355 [Candidatus Saccharibacteria bacterium]|nr:hypothetical protein [Candidatus Saccharibacteria bacterium]
MANRVYDKEGDVDSNGIINPDDQIRQLEQSYNSPSAEISGSDIAKKHDNNSSVEDSGGGKSNADKAEKSKLDNQIGSGFKNDAGKTKTTKGKVKAKLKKKIAIVGGGAAGLAIIAIVVIMFFLSTLKIPHLMENIGIFEFARLSRDFNSALSDVTEEKLALDATDSAGTGLAKSLQDSYGEFRSSTWGKLDKFRPKKILENMGATGKVDYIFESETGAITGLRKDVLKGVMINGQEVLQGEAKWWQVFDKRSNRLKFAGEMRAELEIMMEKDGTLWRGTVAKELREKLGIKLSRWEQYLSPTYRKAANPENLSRLQNKANETVKTYEALDTVVAEKAGIEEINAAAAAAKGKAEECIKNPTCLENYLSGNTKQLDKEVAALITTNIERGALSNILGAFSTIYSIALPVCMIWEGSTIKSGPTMDANSNRSIKTFYNLSSAADQQKAGVNVSTKEIGGLNDQIGDISNAPSELRASGKTVSPVNYSSPQANQAMDFTLSTAIFGTDSVVTDVLNEIMNVCPEITDIKTALALAALETGAGILSLGTVTAGEEAVRLTVTQLLKQMLSKTFSKEFLKDFAKTALLRDVPLIVGGSYLGKLIVASRMGNTMKPIPEGDTLQVQADQGANLVANDIDRKQIYGRSLSIPEVAESNYLDLQDIAYANSKKSVFEKYFNPKNPSSTLVNMAVSLNGTFSQSFVSAVGNFFSSLGSIFRPSSSIFTNLLTGNQRKALAAETSTPYNLVQWGWSNSELNTIQDHPELYSPLNLSQRLESTSPEHQKEIEDRYSPCYTETVADLLKDGKITRDADGNINQSEGDCSPEKLGEKDAFEWRLLKKYNSVVDHGTSIAELTPTTVNAAAAP